MTRFSELEAFLGKTPDADYQFTPGRPTASFPEVMETPVGPRESTLLRESWKNNNDPSEV